MGKTDLGGCGGKSGPGF
ncbi:hypothetical protein LINGRAHAP2_LOCUS26290 [Linum grandiflorum]